jgi:anaerobic magnesium-protoporphyrin IX monomethyl ester cyclase
MLERNKKIALLIPPMQREENYGDMAAAAPELPSLGLAFIAKYLKIKGIECDLLDLSVDKNINDHFLANIKSYALVGMPVFITSVPNVLRFAEKIKHLNDSCLIAVGGPHATLFPEDLLRSIVDFVVTGDGEIPFYHIYKNILAGDYDFSAIKGIYYKNDKHYNYTGPGESVNHLDEIGAPLVEQYNYNYYYPPIHTLGKKVIHTLTSRGCPYNCTFCAAAQIMGRRVRLRSVDDVINEISDYKKHGFDSVIFYDDVFTISRQRTIELCKKIIKRKLDIKWYCFTRTDLIDKEVLNYMRDAGCYLVTFGCESGNDKTLKLLRKGLNVEKNYRGIEMVYEAGMESTSSFMIGLPREDYNDIENSIRFAVQSKLTFAVFPVFEPYKGTPIYDICKETGSWIIDERFKNKLLGNQEEIWVPHGMDRSKIEQYTRKGFIDFYLRPKRIYRIAKNILFYLPMERKMKFINSALQYFIIKKYLKPSQPAPKRYGSKFF